MEYTVEWVHGALGVFVIANSDGLAVVSKLTTPLPAHFTADATVGDVLVQIDGVPMTRAFATTLEALRSKADGVHMALTFRSRLQDLPTFALAENASFTLEWTADAPLGLSFCMDPCSLLTVVSKSAHELPDVGDILSAIGPVETTKMRFEQVMETLSVVAKPVTLHFVSSLRPASTGPAPVRPAPAGTAKLPALRKSTGIAVAFGGGRLGLAFKIKAFPTVSQLLDTTLHPGLNHVRIGDQLVAIDGDSTRGWSMEKVVAMIQGHDGLAPPLQLEFDRPESPPPTPVRQLPPNYYEVIYRGGKLGIVLVSRKGHTEIEDVTDASTAVGLEKAKVGDRLVAIDGRQVHEMDFHKTIEHIKLEAQKPGGVRLLFTHTEKACGDDTPFGLFLLAAVEALLI
ncbi:hypothetical protein ACHHYP_02812 [Achlya hypogyna]|uniref:PDZ domain-containing protein n=1 Tax=Achlya hypogyna TaxID=1202772 RepID=A0A1V9Z5B1_ACHHY|nr:hypothetical protein ACHHYP_02812 [Achlya hypogyna]